MSGSEYDIKRDNNGLQICKFIFEWTDVNNKKHFVETQDIDCADTVMGLLTGEICLADLELDRSY